jgi:hypothetical protein
VTRDGKSNCHHRCCFFQFPSLASVWKWEGKLSPLQKWASAFEVAVDSHLRSIIREYLKGRLFLRVRKASSSP